MARGWPVLPCWKGSHCPGRPFPERINPLCQAGNGAQWAGAGALCEPQAHPWCGQTPPECPCQEGGQGIHPCSQGTKGQHKSSPGISVSASVWLILFPPEVAQSVMFSTDDLMESPAPVWSCCSFSRNWDQQWPCTACHGYHFIPTGISQTKAGMITRPCSGVCVGSGIPTVPCRWSFSTKEEIGLQEKAS